MNTSIIYSNRCPVTLKLHAGCLFIPMLRQLACSDCYILGLIFINKLKIKVMKTAMQEVLEMVNNRTDNSLKTKFTKDEKKFWIEKQKQEIIDFAVWFNNNDNTYKSYDEIVNQYYNSIFGDNHEAGI